MPTKTDHEHLLMTRMSKIIFDSRGFIAHYAKVHSKLRIPSNK